MEKHTFGKEYGFQTRAVHTGNDVDAETGAIKRPITMANSYALPYDPSDLNWSSAGKNLYTRNGGSNQQYLQEKLASLEGGEDCIVLASGGYPGKYESDLYRNSGQSEFKYYIYRRGGSHCPSS